MAKPVAVFPAAIAGDGNLMIASNRLQTALASPMGASDTVMNVQNAAGIVANSLLSIDAEIVQTTANPSGNTIPVQRGFDGTTAAVHLASAKVSGFVDAWHHNAAIAEIQAIEQTLGANLANVPSASPPVSNTAYDFAPQSPGGSLTVGTDSITLTPVPAGVNGTDLNHYLYISGGTGTAEAVKITGGTAVAGSPAGSIFVTCANTHSGAWSIRSATAGIQEAMQAASPKAPWVKVPPGSYSIYGPITPPGGATLEGPGAGYDTNPPPAQLNWIPLTGSMTVVSTDHVTIRGLTFYGGTSGTPTTSIGIDVSGLAPRAAITFQLFDVYVRRFFTGIQLELLSNPRGYGIGVNNNVSHGLVFAGVQGQFTDLFADANGGDGIRIMAASNGNTATPFIVGVQTFNNGGWGIECTVQLNLSKFYLNFDKAGELLYNSVTGGLPGTVIDGHIEVAGGSSLYGTNPSAPGIRVAATSTSGLVISHVQINSNNGNGIELLASTTQLSNSTLAGNGLGGQAGSIYAILAPVAQQIIQANNISGISSFAGNFHQIQNNNFVANSATVALDMGNGLGNTIEGNFINQAGAGVALRIAAGGTVYAPFSNNILNGPLSMLGAMLSGREFIPSNLIQSETGANNALVVSFPNVPLVTGLRIIVRTGHSLQIGINTIAYNGGAAIRIVTNRGVDISAAYPAGIFLTLIYDGAFWEIMS